MAGLERVSVSTTAMRLRELLRCPRCGAEFHPQEKDLTCANGHDFPLADGIPVLSLPDESDAEEHQHSHQEQYYDREYGGYGSYRLDNWQQTYIARLAPLWEVSSPDAPFLDSGVGGSAYTVIEAARKGIPSIGCDISLEGMQTARRLAEAQGVSDRCLFVVCRAERLPFADAIFGGATSIAVLEHVPDDRRAIAELARVTRRAGRVFFAVPNSLDHVPFPLRRIYQRHDRRIGHLRHYSSNELIARGEAVGLRAVKTVYSAHWVKVWQLAIHLVASRLRIRDDRLWWWIEGFDARLAQREDGMHLNVWLERR
jgi:ubiquinone/menaquinone biosynthesis C-methylase UbiE